MVVKRDPVGPGQESVWDYPRPALCERSTKHLVVEHNGEVIAETRAAFRVIETSHPPVYYFPPQDIEASKLVKSRKQTFCEWKGYADYWDLVFDSGRIVSAAWSYPDPSLAFRAMKDHVAFYPYLVDRCLADGVEVVPQPGNYYGGWITPDIAGPFKGEPGSEFW